MNRFIVFLPISVVSQQKFLILHHITTLFHHDHFRKTIRFGPVGGLP